MGATKTHRYTLMQPLAMKATFAGLLSLASLVPSVLAGASSISGKPSLFTGNFFDCLGGQSLFNVTRFDAAYYANPPAIGVHIAGSSNIKKESLMRKYSPLTPGPHFSEL